MATDAQMPAELAGTGIPGLDDVIRGGFPRNRMYLVQGDPGSGKTTMGLQFLLEGKKRGESGIYISFSETRDEIEAVADSHGWSLDGIHLVETTAAEQQLTLQGENTLFEPSEVELREMIERLLAEIERTKAARVVLDSLSEMRLLAQSNLRYRRQVLGLKQFFAGRQCTVLMLDDRTTQEDDRQLQSLAHGVISLENRALDYGADRRRLRVVKLRAVSSRSGHHEFAILKGGLHVFPRLVAAEHAPTASPGLLPSGVEALDRLLGGGPDRGTATLIMGPAGCGKSTLALRYALSAAERGETTAVFAFDERVQTMQARLSGLGMDLGPHLDSGRVNLRQVDPAEMGAGEFSALVRRAVEEDGAQIIIIDTLNGYMNAIPEERVLAVQLHELLSYLSNVGVSSFLVLAQHGLLGQTMASSIDVSYMADTVLLLRYFESQGEVRKAMSVVKKRSGAHEGTIREYGLGLPEGIRIGAPLVGFKGVLTGVPEFIDGSSKLFEADDERSQR
jgi:circadian clock protein KaiC